MTTSAVPSTTSTSECSSAEERNPYSENTMASGTAAKTDAASPLRDREKLVGVSALRSSGSLCNGRRARNTGLPLPIYAALSLIANTTRRPVVRPIAKEPLNPKLTNTGFSRRPETTDGTSRSAAALKLTNSRTGFAQCGHVFTFPNLFISRENRPIERQQCGHFILLLERISGADEPRAEGAHSIRLLGLMGHLAREADRDLLRDNRSRWEHVATHYGTSFRVLQGTWRC